jgi:hypothetical protein
MSELLKISIEILFPKTKEAIKYEFIFTKSQLIVKGDTEIECSYIDEKIGPIWRGGINKNPFVHELETNNVFPPSNFIKAIEIAWVDWIRAKLSDSQLKSALISLIDWLNSITKSKPDNNYWADKF